MSVTRYQLKVGGRQFVLAADHDEEVSRLKAEVAKWQRCESVACDKMLELCGEIKVLKAEVERLRDGVETMTYHAPGVETTAWVRAVEYDRLKAQVERLTKAGDMMAGLIQAIYEGEFSGRCEWEELEAWNAAKEGKPNA